MADIKIVVDTGADIPPEAAEKYDIGIISFLSLFGEEQYVHGSEREMVERCASFAAVFNGGSYRVFQEREKALGKAAFDVVPAFRVCSGT